jgi:hypothetical protein
VPLVLQVTGSQNFKTRDRIHYSLSTRHKLGYKWGWFIEASCQYDCSNKETCTPRLEAHAQSIIDNGVIIFTIPPYEFKHSCWHCRVCLYIKSRWYQYIGKGLLSIILMYLFNNIDISKTEYINNNIKINAYNIIIIFQHNSQFLSSNVPKNNAIRQGYTIFIPPWSPGAPALDTHTHTHVAKNIELMTHKSWRYCVLLAVSEPVACGGSTSLESFLHQNCCLNQPFSDDCPRVSVIITSMPDLIKLIAWLHATGSLQWGSICHNHKQSATFSYPKALHKLRRNNVS